MTEENPNTKRQSFRERCTFDNILIVLIVVGGVIMLVLVVRLLLAVLPILWGGSALKKSYDLLQALIWSIGGLGGAIGLWFSTQRQKTFEKQVQSQIDQVQMQSKQVQVQAEQVQLQSEQVQREADKNFDDRLGRGVELLANENMVMRTEGIRGLVDLVNDANEAQKPILANIIYDFFCDKASIQRNDKHEHLHIAKEERRQDLQNALDFLINLSLDEQKVLLPNPDFGDNLDLSNLDFSHLEFTTETLKNIHFRASYILGTSFKKNVIIENVYFTQIEIEKAFVLGAKIRNSGFREGQIIDSNFYHCTIEESTFINPSFEKTELEDVDIARNELDLVKFVGGKFIKGRIRASSTSGLPHFICTDLSGTSFYFDDDIDLNKYFELCYYNKDQRPSPKMNASREYEFVCKMNVFVESDEPWSGQPVKARIALEIAEWKLEQARETGIDIDARKKDVEAFANELKAAEAEFKRRQAQANNP